MVKSDLIDIECLIKMRTDKAVLVYGGGNDEDDPPIWLPLSQIEIVQNKKSYTITLPEWLAKDKGLI